MSDYPQVPQQISDPISENLAKLRDLFPTAVKDGALDWEALRAELGEFAEVQPGDETYELNWVGKREAKKEAFKPLLGKTLALKDDGKNADTTQNLYIEGDNLEALKLLRQNYYGEVKMIYIDPPYNTGNDFIYADKFAVKSDESEQEEGTITESGQRLVKNERSSNRFHARWLDMIYPRLKLAKDLLREDGIIFISIDDGEHANLRAACNEVFGENNFVESISWKKRYGAGGGTKGFAKLHDYILVYSKTPIENIEAPLSEEQISAYSQKDEKFETRGGFVTQPLATSSKGERSNLMYPIHHQGHIIQPKKGTRWLWSEEKFLAAYRNNEVVINQSGSGWSVRFKQYLKDENGKMRRGKPLSILTGFWNQDGTDELTRLFGTKGYFDFPKPSNLIKFLITFVVNDVEPEEDIILDFFSGSASTAHGVMQLNAEDGGKRRFILVQLPEVCNDDSEAAKAGYKTIAEIGKERIRRAGEKIKEELKAKHADWKKQQAAEAKKGGKLALNEDYEAAEEPNPYVLDPDSLDIGFKSFRIEDTKINWLKKDLRGEQLEFDDTTTQDAIDFVPGSTDTDVVYELMLRQSNIPLTGTITQPAGTGKRTYLYADAYLVCLEEKVTRKLVEALAAIEPTPNKYFFRDSAFAKDIALKDETFRRLKAEIHKHHGDLGTAYTVEFI